jgi:hypothetical protein
MCLLTTGKKGHDGAASVQGTSTRRQERSP